MHSQGEVCTNCLKATSHQQPGCRAGAGPYGMIIIMHTCVPTLYKCELTANARLVGSHLGAESGVAEHDSNKGG